MSDPHDYQSFLDSFFEQINRIRLDISGLPLDHIAFQASTSKEYDALRVSFAKLGDEVHQEMIGGRRVAVFALHTPMRYESYVISVLELIEPKPGQICQSGYQHAEFVVNQPFENYIQQYPHLNWDKSSMDRKEFSHLKFNFENGLTLKFLHEPILKLVSKG